MLTRWMSCFLVLTSMVLIGSGSRHAIARTAHLEGDSKAGALQAAPDGRAPQTAQDHFSLAATTQSDAWRTLFGFVQAAGSGFASWTPRCVLILDTCVPPQRDHDLAKRHLPVHNGAALNQAPFLTQSNEVGQIVMFNPTAVSYFKQLCNTSSTTQTTCIEAASFPVNSVIVRTYWAWVPAGTPAELPLYRSTSQSNAGDIGSAAINNTPVSVTMNAQTPCPAPTDSAATLSISCFYSVPITAGNALTYRLEDSQGPKPNDTLVLLGFHVMQRQATGWSFTTFYWQDDIENAAYTCARTASGCPGGDSRWGHYAMKAVEIPSDGVPYPAVANPYFEGGDENNRATNCVVCHSFAANPLKPPTIEQLISSSFGAAGPVTPGAHQRTLNAFLQQMPRQSADMVWSVAQERDLHPTGR